MDSKRISRGQTESRDGEFGRLLEAARGGDRDALGRLLSRSQGFLEIVCLTKWRGRLGGSDEAADVIQQTFLDAHCGFAGFRGDSQAELNGWLESILCHNVTDAARREDRRAEKMRQVVSIDDSDDGRAAREQFMDEETASWKAMIEEREREVEQAVAELPEHYRQVLSWRHWDGLSFGRIAALLDTTTEGARKLWGRAVQRLRERLDGSGKA